VIALPAKPVTSGTKTLYGRTLTIPVTGKPALFWFRAQERFDEHWSTTIEAVRPSCRKTPRITHAGSEYLTVTFAGKTFKHGSLEQG